MRIPEPIKQMINQWGTKKTIKVTCMCVAGLGAAFIIGDKIFKDDPEVIFEISKEV